MNTDKRYTVTREYTGHITAEARFVVRFCDDYIADYETKQEANKALLEH